MLIKGAEDLGNLVDKLITYYVGTTDELKEKVGKWGYYLFLSEVGPSGVASYEFLFLDFDKYFLISLPFAIDHLSRLYNRLANANNPSIKVLEPFHHTPNIIGKMREYISSIEK